MEKYWYNEDTKIGTIGITSENGMITQVIFNSDSVCPEEYTAQKTKELSHAFQELNEYLNGTRFEFNIDLKPSGTEFQKKVWHELQNIPYGEVRSYEEIAIKLNNPKGARAVGMANNKNPIPIFIPCHRVIGKNGTLTGYRGGIDMKQTLLAIEKKLTNKLY